MKPQVFETLRQSPIRRPWDWVLLLVAAALWYGAVRSRVLVIDPYCPSQPALCSAEKVPAFDRFLLHSEEPRADEYSFLTQNLSGVIALLLPLLLHLARLFRRQAPLTAAGRSLGLDWMLLLQTTMLNGLLTELTRIIVQRPRPFVFANPERGYDAANYTAFYSGHTSFAAASMTALWLILLSRGAPRWSLALAGASGFSLVFLTAVYRVLAGRHFLSDTLIAALAGFAVAWCVAWIHRPRTGPALA